MKPPVGRTSSYEAHRATRAVLSPQVSAVCVNTTEAVVSNFIDPDSPTDISVVTLAQSKPAPELMQYSECRALRHLTMKKSAWAKEG